MDKKEETKNKSGNELSPAPKKLQKKVVKKESFTFLKEWKTKLKVYKVGDSDNFIPNTPAIEYLLDKKIISKNGRS